MVSATVAVVGLVVAGQTGLFSRSSGSGAGVPVETPTSLPGPVAPALDPLPGLQAEIDRLNAELAERAASYDALAASVKGQEDETARLTALLAERDKEIADLRSQIADLQRQQDFDTALAALKSDDGLARLETARAETSRIETGAAASALAQGSVQGSGQGSDMPADAAAGAAPTTTAMRAVSEIHFDPSSSRLTPGGQAHAAAAAVTLRDLGINKIRVVGYTDRVGSPTRNRALAETRARAVADFLVSAGLPASGIEVVGMGEAELPVATADGVAEPLNRCVTIEVLPL